MNNKMRTNNLASMVRFLEREEDRLKIVVGEPVSMSQLDAEMGRAAVRQPAPPTAPSVDSDE